MTTLLQYMTDELPPLMAFWHRLTNKPTEERSITPDMIAAHEDYTANSIAAFDRETKRLLGKLTEESLHGLRRIMHECRHDPNPQLTHWLDVAEATEAEVQAAEAAKIDAWLPCGDVSELGSRVIVSGGEIMELDSRPVAGDEFDEGLPI